MYLVTKEEISPQPLMERVKSDSCGAVVTFLGTVRDFSEGRRVLHLEYEAYKEMAEGKMQQIGAEIQQRWGLERVAMVHRVGKLEIGEMSLIVAVAAPHRREAFQACQYAVDRLKEIVPIWKKEVWEGGEAWVGAEEAPATG